MQLHIRASPTHRFIDLRCARKIVSDSARVIVALAGALSAAMGALLRCSSRSSMTLSTKTLPSPHGLFRGALLAFVLILILVVPAAPVRAQGETTGTVVGGITQGKPLPGAVVSIRGTGRADTTDQEGVFVLTAVPAGRQVLEARHPRLTRLGLAPLQQEVEVGVGDTTRVKLPVPGAGSFVDQFCPDSAAGSAERGAFAGQLVHVGTGRPLGGVRLRVAWLDSVRLPAGREPSTGARLSRTDSAGRFTVCGVPAGSTIQALVGAGGSGRLTDVFRMPEDGFLHRRIAYRTRGERPPSGNNDSLLSTRSTAPDSADFVLPPLTVPIETGETMAGFRRRRKNRDGHFFTREEILSTDPVRLSDVFRHRSLPEVDVEFDPDSRSNPYRVRLFDPNSGWQSWCAPGLVVDGRVIPRKWIEKGLRSVNDFDPSEIEAMEVYWKKAEVPSSLEEGASSEPEGHEPTEPIFQGGDPTGRPLKDGWRPDCGAILLWTGEGGQPDG